MRFANPPRSRSLLFPELTLTHVRQGKRQHGGIVSDNNGGNVQPGWYPSDGQMRYWDGNAWTEQTRPLQADAASVPTQPYGQPQQPVQPVYVVGQKKSHTLRNVLLILVLLWPVRGWVLRSSRGCRQRSQQVHRQVHFG